MLLLEVMELLSLIGLFVQAFVAWGFVAVLAATRDRGESPGSSRGAYQSFLGAFVALALALTVISVRFLWLQNGSGSQALWLDGELRPTVSHALYMGLKGVFGLLLVQGSVELGGGRGDAFARRLRVLRWPLVGLLAFSAIPIQSVGNLFLVQAPFLIVCAGLALRALRPLAGVGSGLRIVRAALLGLALSWTGHIGSVLAPEFAPAILWMRFNSFIDLAVQLTLGMGLVVTLVQDAHRRLHESERERERLRRVHEKDEKLRALGTAVSGVAHELNNPLTVILAYAEDLQRERVCHERATIVLEAAERCHGIVRNLSALAGQSVHPREELDIESLARRVVRGISAEELHEERRVVVEPMGGLRVSADRIGLEQVVSNLVINGLQACPPGGVVTVRGCRSGSSVELVVTDAGAGVPPELRETLFEPFFTTKEPGKGTGLGLAISHAIVRGHAGTIEVEDGDGGRGASFRVRLPGSVGDSTEPGRARRAADDPRSSAPGETQGAGLQLLVVDDDAAVRSILRVRAELRGWEVSEAATAEDALRNPLPEGGAVLCDLRMPGMGGVGFHDRLASESPQALERVVFVTGDRAAPEVRRFVERCERPLLQKPFDFDELFACLREAAGVAFRPEDGS